MGTALTVMGVETSKVGRRHCLLASSLRGVTETRAGSRGCETNIKIRFLEGKPCIYTGLAGAIPFPETWFCPHPSAGASNNRSKTEIAANSCRFETSSIDARGGGSTELSTRVTKSVVGGSVNSRVSLGSGRADRPHLQQNAP